MTKMGLKSKTITIKMADCSHKTESIKSFSNLFFGLNFTVLTFSLTIKLSLQLSSWLSSLYFHYKVWTFYHYYNLLDMKLHFSTSFNGTVLQFR